MANPSRFIAPRDFRKEKMPNQCEIDIARYERAKSMANFYIWAVKLQIDRLNAEYDASDDFVLKPIADFEFLMTAIVRFRRAADLAKSVAAIKTNIETGISEFDEAIPIREIRNIQEHFDDYANGTGRNPSRNNEHTQRGLQVHAFQEGGVEWLGQLVKYDDCIAACERLLERIQKARVTVLAQRGHRD